MKNARGMLAKEIKRLCRSFLSREVELPNTHDLRRGIEPTRMRMIENTFTKSFLFLKHRLPDSMCVP